MITEQMYKLTMKPVTWELDGTPLYSGPTFAYEVEGTPYGEFRVMIAGPEKRRTWRSYNMISGTCSLNEYHTPGEALVALEYQVNA
jgi:hypothetical protein